MPTDEAIVKLFRKLEEVLEHEHAVTLVRLLDRRVVWVLDRQIPGWAAAEQQAP